MKLLNNIIATIIIVFLTAGAIYAVETRHLPTLKMPSVQIPKLALKTDFFKQKPTVTPKPKVDTTTQPSRAPTPTIPPQIWALVKKVNGKTEIVKKYSLDKDYSKSVGIYRYKDFLLYFDDKNQQILKENISNGKRYVVFDVNNTIVKDHISSPSDERSIGLIKFSGDIIIFTSNIDTSNFDTEGATYIMNLSTDEMPRRLLDFPGNIEKVKDRNFIVRYDGMDTCGGRITYATFDEVNLKAQKIAETFTGCRAGDKYIDIDSSGRMIVAYGNGDSGPGAPFFDDIPKFESVMAIPLDDPSKKEGLIAKQDMPADVTDIEYLAERNNLVLIGKAAYTFDLSTKELKKIVDFPAKWQKVWVSKHNGNSVCLLYPVKAGERPDDPDIYGTAEVKLSEGQFIEKSEACPKEPIYANPPQEEKTNPLEDLTTQIDNLNLPENYELILWY